jgi:hypothetical protein
MSGQFHAPAALPPGIEHLVPIGYEVGWTPEPVWTTWRKFLTLPGLDSDHSVVQPVASRYTDWAIPAPKYERMPTLSLITPEISEGVESKLQSLMILIT